MVEDDTQTVSETVQILQPDTLDVRKGEINTLNKYIGYKLEETTVPSGYNKAADIEFEVVATYDKTLDPVELTGLEVKEGTAFTVDKAAGTLTTDVINRPGFAFPTTGGMGTTVIYTLGAILALGSGVVFVTRKRMNK